MAEQVNIDAIDTKQKKYLKTDVYEEAIKRIKHIIMSFDNVIVCFSGGKDSLTVLELTKEVYKMLGVKEKIKVCFRDEELIPDDVIDFVKSKAESGEYDFRYYAIPLKSTKFILGETYDYIQWDKNRKHFRTPPEYAIRQPEDDGYVYSQYDADEFICKDEIGSVALLTGQRADESLIRFRSVVNKRNENYINSTKSRRIKICKPIYDWREKDVFTYFCKNDIKYCEIYDKELINGSSLRVATPFLAESSKKFYKLKTLYPVFYQQLVDIFPEMIVQEKYWTSLDRNQTIDKYEHTFNGIRKYILENVAKGHQQELALERVNACEKIRRGKEKEGTDNLGGYPVLYVFKSVLNGHYKRMIMPKSEPSQAEIDYENGE